MKLVHSEKKLLTGYIYQAINRIKEIIVREFSENEDNYREMYEITDKKWEIQIHRHLHVVGYYFNLAFFYDHQTIQGDKEIIGGLCGIMQKTIRMENGESR